MTSQQIRERGVDIRNPEALEAFKVEILQELTAQLADLNEKIAGLGVVADRGEEILNRIAFAAEAIENRGRF